MLINRNFIFRKRKLISEILGFNFDLLIICISTFIKAIMLLYLHAENPQPRTINTIVDCLQDGGLIIYPTDTIYGLGCDIFHHKAIMKL